MPSMDFWETLGKSRLPAISHNHDIGIKDIAKKPWAKAESVYP